MVFIFLKWVNTQRQPANEPLTNQGNSVSKMCKINRIQHEEQSNGDPAWSLWIQYEQGLSWSQVISTGNSSRRIAQWFKLGCRNIISGKIFGYYSTVQWFFLENPLLGFNSNSLLTPAFDVVTRDAIINFFDMRATAPQSNIFEFQEP